MAERSYEFGPLQRPTLLLGLRGPQVAVAAVGLAAAVAVLSVLAPPGNAVAAVGVVALAAAVCFVPVSGRGIDDWLPVVAGWVWRRGTGGHRFTSTTPVRGHDRHGRLSAEPPPGLGGVEILAASAGSEDLGVVADRRADAYTALLAAEGTAFALEESAEKQRLLAGWDEVLTSLAAEGSPIARLQWVERTAPEDGHALAGDLAARGAKPADAPPVASYRELLAGAGPAATRHDLLLAVQVQPRRAGRAMRRTGETKDTAAAGVLADQTRLLSRRLAAADVRVVDGGLGPRQVAAALHTAANPDTQPGARQASRGAGDSGADPGAAWPLATETHWNSYRTDGGWHATFWIAEWPRTPVGPDFLAPLLLGTAARRTVAVTMEPQPPAKAVRAAEQARTTGLAEDQLRTARGFLTSHRRRRQADDLERRAGELQAGYADYRFAGYVTVTGATADELEDACAQVAHAAAQSGLQLRRLVGQQDTAFTFTLPLCRGLARR
jgi:hypothetical protein